MDKRTKLFVNQLVISCGYLGIKIHTNERKSSSGTNKVNFASGKSNLILAVER
jgi:hypothetical protein